MIFEFCPKCKSRDIGYDGLKQFSCEQCGWVYFHNTAAAAGVLIQYRDKLLFIVRGKGPGKGRLDLPGGFVDPGESSEQTARREIREELGIELESLTYRGSYPNTYHYEGIVYSTCDTVFLARIEQLPSNWNKQEVENIKLLRPGEVNPDDIAFESIRAAVADYIRNEQRPGGPSHEG
jgi:NADH pyrophosphatase NudC (nudix superfamily)